MSMNTQAISGGGSAVAEETHAGHDGEMSGDVVEGSALGIVGGAIVGVFAGGPLGAIVGAVVGGIASALGTAAVEKIEESGSDEEQLIEADPAESALVASVESPAHSRLASLLAQNTLMTDDDRADRLGERVSTDDIRLRAYAIYESRGRADGLALQDWLKAERETTPVGG